MIRAGMIIVLLSLLLIFAFRLPTVVAAQDQTALPTKPVRVEITVTDAREPRMYVTGLSKDQITVLDEKIPQEVAFFGQSDQPMSIGLVFDTSRAHYISRDKYANLLASTKEAFLNFIKGSENDNQYFIVGFDENVYLAADWMRTPEQVAVGFDRLAGVKSSKKTALYDALHAALVKVNSGSNQKRIIILVSDGRDNGSKLKLGELLDAVRRSDALIYTVSVRPPDFTSFDFSYGETLNKLSSSSGGMASYPRTVVDFYEVFERLSVELKNQYTLSFMPRNVGCKGEWRRLRFKAETIDFTGTPAAKKLGKMQLSVRAREGYYCSS